MAKKKMMKIEVSLCNCNTRGICSKIKANMPDINEIMINNINK